MPQRIHYIDIVKGFGIFWVVWAHVAHIEGIWEYVWPFHMPLFFFISGLLFNNQIDFRTFLKKRIKTLLIPYALFFLLTFAYWVLIERHYRSGGYSMEYELVGLVYGTYEGGHLFFNVVLWFLPCLFTVEMLFFPISRLQKPAGIIGGIVLLFTIGQVLLHNRVNWLPFGLHTAFNAILFYGAGFLLKDTMKQMMSIPLWQKGLFLLACFCFQMTFYGRYLSNIQACTITYAAIAFGGVLFYVMLSVLIKENTVLEFLGRNTLVILCLHAPICRALNYGASILTNVPVETIRSGYLSSLGITVLAILAVIPFMYLWRAFKVHAIPQ